MPANSDSIDDPTSPGAEPAGRTRLEDEHAVLSSVVADAPLGIALFDAEFRCLRINRAMAELQGVSVADTLGRTPAQYVPGAWPRLEPLFRRALEGPVAAVELRGAQRTASGDHHWWQVSAYSVPLPDGSRGVGVIASNISDRKRAERALAEREADLSALFSSIDEGFCVCEMVTDDAGKAVDYRFIEVNPLFESMTGLVDAGGHTALELVPDLERQWVDTYARVGLGRETLRFEQGSEAMGRWFDVFATPLGPTGRFAIVFKDVTERRRQQQDLLSSAALDAYRVQLTDVLRSVTDPVDVQTQAARLLGRHLNAARVHYGEVEADGRHAIVAADHSPTGVSLVGRHRLDDHGPAVMELIRSGVTVAVDEVATDPRLTDRDRAATTSLGVGSYVLVPLEKEGRTAALLAVHHDQPHQWTEADLAAIAETAERTGAALERARADARLRLRHARAELVADLLAGLEAEPTAEAQLQHLAAALVPELADYVTIEAPGQDPYLLTALHRDPDQLATLVALRNHHRLSIDEAYSVGRVATGEPQMLSVITPAVRSEYVTNETTAALLEQLGPHSHMAAPLDLGGGVRGVLMVGLVEADRPPFTPDDLDFLRETAQRAGIVLVAGRLRHLQHEISLRLQQALLPDTIQWHPNLEIEARYHAASDFLEVGGDWYDTYSWPDGPIGVIVGDVVGHNLDSAAAMGRLRAATTALAGRLGPDPSALLSALDDYARGPDGTNFATVVCVVVDPDTGQLTYASAGHPPALVISPSGAVSRLDQAQSPPLCSIHSGPWARASIRLEPGSLVVAYSDGLIERRDENLLDGIDRLEKLAARLIDEPIATIADEVTRAMGAHSPPEDDVVVTCFRYTPALDRLVLQVPAHTGQLGVLRDELRRWLDQRAIDNRLRDDILLAVGEACSNAIEHAYHERDNGLVDIALSDHLYHLTARISDHGMWRPPGSHSRLRGRGTGIMRALTTRFTRQSGPSGTTVELNLAAPRRHATANRS